MKLKSVMEVETAVSVAKQMYANQIKKLEEDNEQLKAQISELENSLAERIAESEQTEARLKEKIKQLTTENQAAERVNRELRTQITALQARPPEVVTKVERVEVTSDHIQKNLDEVTVEKTQLQEKVASLEKQFQESKAQLHTAQANSVALEKQLKSYEERASKAQEGLEKELQELKKTKVVALESAKRESEEKLMKSRRKFDRLMMKLSVIQPTVAELVQDYLKLKEMCQSIPQTVKLAVQQTTKQVSKALAEVSAYNKELVRKYKKEMALRKKYHNELVDLKGNIRVFCRVRPKIKEDGTGPSSEAVVEYDQYDDTLVNVANRGRTQTFEMDVVFNQHSSQEEVFSEVQPLVLSCIDGYNVCIFAYGQTGSGKTYTMEGPQQNPGINQRALQELFNETADRSQEWEFTISVSVMEIYNEMLRDLLTPDSSYKLEVKMNPDGGLHVPGLKSQAVSSVADVNEVFNIGQRNRATACTNMNEHSSRSHALLVVYVTGTNRTTGVKTMGKLNLVDLAGSERVSKSGADGARLKEAQNINKSLACLGDVIHALRSRQNFIPYRNSKLTYLLQDSLGGDSKTLMIVQVSPVEKNVGESIASLSFAQRVRTVELGAATKKVESAEVVELREKLAQYESSSYRGLTNGNGNGNGNGKTPRRK